MAKKLFVSVSRVVPFVILLSLLLTGCSCKHEWNPATCTAPQTCSLCQLTEGEALGHTWTDATCEAPKTCSVCKATEGTALGHTWVDATCETPKTCSVCKATEGELANHKWIDATTETPKTCSVCQTTEGDRIITDSRFKTANCKDLFGTWAGMIEVPGSTIVEEGFNSALRITYTLTFNNDGTYQETTTLQNKDEFNKAVEDYYVDTFYKEFASQGMDQAQADEATLAVYGMNVSDYAKKLASAFNWDALFATELKGVYFVAENGKLHSGTSWNRNLQTDSYSISNNTLTLDSLKQEYPDLTLTRS